MAGTIPLSMTQQLDELGNPLVGGHLYLIQAGTTSTPQNGFQDSALTLPLPNPIILDASGRLPQFFLADGSIKVRLTDVNGVEKLVADGLIVTGASSGGGGGSPVDPTTVLQTGWLQAIYGIGVVSGFVRCNARTIGSAVSGATERANADTNALFSFLWNGDPNLTVSTGRGASAAADFASNKTIAIPDWRGRALAALDDMGNTAAGRLTATYFGTAATVLGAAGGHESATLLSTHIPANLPYTDPGHTHLGHRQGFLGGSAVGDAAMVGSNNGGLLVDQGMTTNTTGITINPGGGAAHAIASPAMLATIYIKL
jgi:hypothetical protein